MSLGTDYMCPPGEVAIADTLIYWTLEQAVLPKGRNDCVKDLVPAAWIACLNSHEFLQSKPMQAGAWGRDLQETVLYVQAKWINT